MTDATAQAMFDEMEPGDQERFGTPPTDPTAVRAWINVVLTPESMEEIEPIGDEYQPRDLTLDELEAALEQLPADELEPRRRRHNGTWQDADPSGLAGKGKHDDDAEEEAWTAVDLGPAFRGEKIEPPATFITRSDGISLFPPGLNGTFGDSGDGKSFLKLIGALERIRNREHVIWITYEDPNELEIVKRLRLLGASQEQCDEFLHVIIATEPFQTGLIWIASLIRTMQAGYVILDSIGEAFAVDGVNEDRDSEVGPWMRRNLRGLLDLAADPMFMPETKPVALMIDGIDHSTKANDSPYYASGSKRKRAVITGLYCTINVIRPLGIDAVGVMHLVNCKDRTGRFRKGQIVAVVTMDATTTPYTVTIDPPHPGAVMTTGKSRNATERILEVVKKSAVPLEAGEITRLVNDPDYRRPDEAEVKMRTIQNSLTNLTNLIKTTKATGTGKSVRITYQKDDRDL